MSEHRNPARNAAGPACRALAFLATLPCAALATPALAAPEESTLKAPPRPVGDYAVRGTVKPKGEASLAYHEGRMRVEVMDGEKTILIGFIDPKARKLVMLPIIAGTGALEVDLPSEFGFLNMPADSRHVGMDVIATEPCEIWQGTEPATSLPVESCITPDGVPLRAKMTASDGTKVSFEVTELERTPQDPEDFELPPGVKVRAIPSALQKMVPGGLMR